MEKYQALNYLETSFVEKYLRPSSPRICTLATESAPNKDGFTNLPYLLVIAQHECIHLLCHLSLG